MQSLPHKATPTQEEWYIQLIEECKAIITEAIFTHNWALVEGYHQLGKRILEEHDNFERAKIYGKEICSHVSESLGKSRQTINRAIQFAKKYPELELLPEGKNATWHDICNKYLPEPREDERIKLPEGIYDIIYIDPPWQYSNSGISGAAENHYPTMSIEELSKLEIPSAKNSTMFIWVTNPILFEALPLIKTWDFEYKTNMVWIKDIAGQGFYVKGQHELLLICVKGNHRPDDSLYVRSVIQNPRLAHSQKPEVFYEIIEKLYPNGKYLEMFARNKRKGWTSWGNEI